MRGCAEEFGLPRLLASPAHAIGDFFLDASRQVSAEETQRKWINNGDKPTRV